MDDKLIYLPDSSILLLCKFGIVRWKHPKMLDHGNGVNRPNEWQTNKSIGRPNKSAVMLELNPIQKWPKQSSQFWIIGDGPIQEGKNNSNKNLIN